ncbi:MAG TPA: hypothetical protein VFW87_14780 [Pirellulales bacterium]|nr:hypothetical protein [Pirellulales bacterium]
MPGDRFSAEPWNLNSTALAVYANAVRLKSACKAIFQGLVTGGDAPLVGEQCDGAVRFAGECIALEPGIVRPLLKGPDARRFRIHFSGHYVIYPYKAVGGKTELMAESEIAEQFQ